MPMLNLLTLCDYASQRISEFHDARIERLAQLELRKVLRRKNPYLFRAKDILTASSLIESIMAAFLSSSEEQAFGAFLEDLAIFVSEQVCGGAKSSAPGLDLEFARDACYYPVSIKSGPNWGNSSQKTALRADFRRARTVQRQRNSGLQVESVLGICYGRNKTTYRGEYTQYTGQSFWHFLSGDANLYVDIIEPIGHDARKHNDDFERRRVALVNQFTKEFVEEFCDDTGNIDWPNLVRFVSGNMA